MSTETIRPRKIIAREFAAALADAGIIDQLDSVRRIVIDAQAGHPVHLYVERYGDERLLNVALTLDGIEISGVPA